MSMRYFGTDGVRGRVGQHPMTVEFALRLAGAAARVLAPDGGRVLVGKDTRLSGYMFEAALEAGFVAAGVDVLLAGPLPTPGIAYLVRELGCDFGAVISASHNRYDDNGIKFFDREGSKLADDLEGAIESHPWRDWGGSNVADAQRMPGAQSRWSGGKDLSWIPLRPERVVEVKYDHMQADRFRHAAIFLRWRPDKPPQACRYDQLDVTTPYELAKVFGAG